MRYGLQVHEVRVPVERERYDEERLLRIADRFERRYEEIYGRGTGYREAGIDIVSFEVEAIGRLRKPALKRYEPAGEDPSEALRTVRNAYFRQAGGFVPTRVYRMERLRPRNLIEGPAIVEAATTTVVIPPEMVARVDEYLNLVIDLEG